MSRKMLHGNTAKFLRVWIPPLLLILTGSCFVPCFGIHIDSVLARGDSSVNIVWTPTSVNTGSDWWSSCGSGCSDELKKCDFLPDRTYRGVAYSYGGEDPFYLFRARLLDGWPVGSHLCHYSTCGDPSSSVTGTDCSGYVCWVWDEPRVSTRELATFDRYDHIEKNELEAGDILVKHGSHTVLVVDAFDNPEVLVWEAAGTPVNGVRERVINLNDTYWDDYQAVRNPRITSGNVSNRERDKIRRVGELLAEGAAGPAGCIRLYDVQGTQRAVYRKALSNRQFHNVMMQNSCVGVAIARYIDINGNQVIIRKPVNIK
ncbi:MAG: hypothetical protein GF350_13795 [Chitinivibrionales bacterium]|nr:hypothetical protein [Chitinivibrionales bacterium]